MVEFTFSHTQRAFFEKELGISVEVMGTMNESELDNIYEKVLEIELAETPSGDREISKRGKTAIEIVNIMADILGYVQND